MKNLNRFFAAALTAASVVAAQPASAQSYLSPSTPEKGLWLEATRSNFADVDVTLPTSVWYLSGRLPITERVRVLVDVPFAYASFDDDATFGDESSSVFGNPLVAVEYAAIDGLVLELGARAPLTTADEESFADVFGFLGEPQRGEAFLEDIVPVSGAATYEQAVTPALSLRARGGVTAAFYTGDDDEQETNTFLDYGVFGTYSVGIARFGTGVSGRWLATADEGNFSDNSVHQFGITADAEIGGVRPGLSFRVPLNDEYRDIVEYNLGAYLQVPIR